MTYADVEDTYSTASFHAKSSESSSSSSVSNSGSSGPVHPWVYEVLSDNVILPIMIDNNQLPDT